MKSRAAGAIGFFLGLTLPITAIAIAARHVWKDMRG